MASERPIHPDFEFLLSFKEQGLIDLFCDLREMVLDIYPNCNELLYHTHALTATFSISEKLGDTFCMIPIYSKHLHLGFYRGTLLSDPDGLLTGTGKLIRHIAIQKPADYRNNKVKGLVWDAVAFSIKDMDKPPKMIGQTISKIGGK